MLFRSRPLFETRLRTKEGRRRGLNKRLTIFFKLICSRSKDCLSLPPLFLVRLGKEKPAPRSSQNFSKMGEEKFGWNQQGVVSLPSALKKPGSSLRGSASGS